MQPEPLQVDVAEPVVIDDVKVEVDVTSDVTPAPVTSSSAVEVEISAVTVEVKTKPITLEPQEVVKKSGEFCVPKNPKRFSEVQLVLHCLPQRQLPVT